MPAINLYLFGAPRLEINNQPVSFDTRKAVALLAYLLLTGRVHARDSLSAFFWPEFDQSRSRAALRRTLSTLNKAIGPEKLIITRESIAINPGAPFWCDVQEFNRLFAESQAIGCNPEDCLQLQERAIALYRNDFMAGFSLRDSLEFDDWQLNQSESLRNSLAVILENLARGYAERSEFETALIHARRLSTLDPLLEEAHRLLMMLYAWSGQRNAALRQYRECIRILERELGVQPLEETTEIYQAILEDRLPAPKHAKTSSSAGFITPASNFPTSPYIPGCYPLVGRSTQWTTLHQAYANSRPDGRITFLEGEPGIGKTRLAEDFISASRDKGARTFRSRCYEGETDLAYGPFLAGLQDLLDQPGSADWLQMLPRQWLGEAARLLPSLPTIVPELPAAALLEGPGAQVRFYEGLRQVLVAALAGDPPGILFLDDVHWADAASLDLLAYITRRLKGTPVFILITTRSDVLENQSSLVNLYTETIRSGIGDRLVLDRLSLGEISQLVASTQTTIPGGLEGFDERLYRESEGLPLVVVHYLEVIAQGDGDPGQLLWNTPGSLLDVLRSRLTGLNNTASQLIGAAAVIGRSFDLDTLRLASGRSEPETVSGLESLLARRLISEQAESEHPGQVVFDFTHEKLRQLVYQDTSHARRRLLHRRVAEVLSGDDPSAPSRSRRKDFSQTAVIANHYHLAGMDDQAAHYFMQAGVHARSLYANQEAIAHFQAALAGGHPSQAWLHGSIGDLQTFNGDYQEAIASYQTAAALSQSSDPDSPAGPVSVKEAGMLADLEHKLGEVHYRLGEWDLAEGHFRAALAELAGSGSPEIESRIYADWSRTALSRDSIARASQLAQEAQRLAEASQDQLALAQTANILGILARRSHNDLGLALMHLNRSLEIAETLPAPSPRIAALNNLALVHADLGQLDRAISLTQQALDLCVRLGDRHRQAALNNNLADFYHTSGEGGKAMDHLKQAVAIFAEIGGYAGLDASEVRSNPEIWMLTEW